MEFIKCRPGKPETQYNVFVNLKHKNGMVESFCVGTFLTSSPEIADLMFAELKKKNKIFIGEMPKPKGGK